MVLVCAAIPRAQAGDNKQACVPEAYGLPGSDPVLGAFYGPPYWVGGWSNAVSGRVLDVRDSDPRWVNAGGASISDALTPGSALSPVEVRLLTSGVEGTNHLYFSAKLNVGDTSGARILRIALQPGGGQPSKIIRVRIKPNPRSGMQVVEHCADTGATPDATCDGLHEAHFRVWEEDSTVAGTYNPCYDAGAAAGSSCHPDNATPTWLVESLRAWKESASVWTVQFRAPVVAAGTSFSQGLSASTQVSMDFAMPITGGPDPAWYKWPRTLPFASSPVDDTTLSWPLLAEWGSFRSKTGVFAAPTGGPGMNACEAISVETNSGLGVTHDPAGGTDFNTILLTTQVKGANEVSGMPDDPIRNEFVVRLKNDSTRDIQPGEITAEFRVAKWGATIGDVRGDLASGWLQVPATSPGSNPATNTSIIPAGTTGNVHFGWELSPTQRCQFGVATANDLASLPGCTATFGQHQCIMVDLTGASSLNVDFETRGTWNNFDFRTLSKRTETATIDVRDLPLPAHDPDVDVYLIGMARNMPGKMPAGITGATGIAAAANEQIAFERQVFGGYGYGGVPLYPEGEEQPNMDPVDGPKPIDPRVWGDLPRPQLPVLAGYIPEDSFRRLRAIAMLGLLEANTDPMQAAQAVFSELGQAATSALVPTLDIYVYYQDKATKKLMPMAGFSYFLTHQGPVEGYEWVIDGADRLSPNVYRLRVKRDSTADIQLRLQAREPGEPALDPPSGQTHPPDPPCSGCCCSKRPKPTSHAMANYALPMIGVVIGVGVRRRRKRGERDEDDKRD